MTNRRRLAAALVGVLSLAVTAACNGGGKSAASTAAATSSVVGVVASPAAAGWVRLLEAGGIAATQVAASSRPTPGAVLVLPMGSSATAKQQQSLAAWVRSGGRLVTSDAAMLSRFGVGLGAETTVARVVEPLVGQPVIWRHPLRGRPLTVPPQTAALATTERGAQLVSRLNVSKGAVIALAIDPLSDKLAGYELFPGLVGTILQWPGVPRTPTRLGTEVYLDPGTLPQNERGPAVVAERIARLGVRVVHVAAWDRFDDVAADPDYRSLVNQLHARGVLAYAWIEPPYVSLRMWTHHPECREKNVGGKDAQVAWRSLIALEQPSCFQLAWKDWHDQLTDADWDGVDVGELYFERNDANDPRAETPYSAAALRLFGKSPKTQRAAWLRFRIKLDNQLNAMMLRQVSGLPHADQMEVVLTVLDDTLDPTLAYEQAQDTVALAGVASKAGATLNVEDPYSQWKRGPLRYDALTNRFKSVAAAGAWMLDVNVVVRPGAYPTQKMTGSELDLAAQSASQATGRVATYALGTVADGDLARMSYALGSHATVAPDGSVTTPFTVQVTAPPGADTARLLLDGLPWPTADGTAFVPSGTHHLTWLGGRPAGPGLLRFTGELATAKTSAGTVSLKYFSRARTFAVFNARPTTVRVDGSVVPSTVTTNPDGGWTLQLPPGQHDVVVSCSA